VIWLDHVLVACSDLEAAARHMERDHGLRAFAGGIHTELGTANWVVSLDDQQYIELIAVHDPEVARSNAFGRSVAARAAAGDGLLTWAVRTDDIDGVASRLGLTPRPGRIEDEHGEVTGSWNIVLPPEGSLALPFFVQYEIGAVERPARRDAAWRGAEHPSRAIAIEHVEVHESPDMLDAWLGPHDLPVTASRGRPGLDHVRIACDGEPVLIE
jgi:hypothetical protein